MFFFVPVCVQILKCHLHIIHYTETCGEGHVTINDYSHGPIRSRGYNDTVS